MAQRRVTGKLTKAHFSADRGSCGREVADRIIEAVTVHGSNVDHQQLEIDIRRLAHNPAGGRLLEDALGDHADEDVGLIVQALIYRIAADLTCKSELFACSLALWSVFGVAAMLAGAAVLLAATDPNMTWHLWWLAGAAVALSSVGLAAAALRRRNTLAEVAALRAMAVACKTVTKNGGY